MILLKKPISVSLPFALSVVVVVTLPLSLLLSSFVSYTMDEFLVYHALACSTQPFSNMWNRGREACGGYDLALLPWLTPEPLFLPLRTYQYVGSIQGLFYAPLYWIWNSPSSSRFFGVFLIGVQGILICRIFGQSLFLVLPLLLLFMPYVLQHLLDVGQLSLCTTAIFLLVFLHKRWMEELISNRQYSWLIAIVVGITNVAILWFRLNNVAYLPAYLLMQAACMSVFGLRIAWRLRRWTLIRQGAWILGIFVIGAFIWFSAIDRSGIPLYHTILDSASRSAAGQSTFLVETWDHFYHDLSKYFVNPLLAAHVEHDVNLDSSVEGLGLCAVLATFLISCWSTRRTRRYILFSVVGICAFIVGTTSISSVSKSWGMHHLIPVFPLLILALFSQIRRKGMGSLQIFLLLCFAIINLRLYKLLAHLNPANESFDRRLIDFNEEINRRFAKSHFMIIGSWGIYYTKLVYGPTEQSLIYADVGDVGAIAAAKRADEVAKKPALFIIQGRPPEGYWRNFAEKVEEVTMEVKVGSWQVWREVLSR